VAAGGRSVGLGDDVTELDRAVTSDLWPLCIQTDEVFLEAQIQNITTSPMFMEKVSLEPSMMYHVTELNTAAGAEDG